MTGAPCLSPFRLPPRDTGRLGRALALSAALHLLLSAWLGSGPLGGNAGPRPRTALTVRLVPQPVTTPESAASPAPEILSPAPRARRRVPDSDRERGAARTHAAARPVDTSRPVPLPQVPDPAYYTARDLDVYPLPVAPLPLDRIAEGIAAPGRVKAALRIDEQGVVNDVDLPEPAVSDELKERLRTVLAATRFHPARRDGRAVKSRVTLSVDFGQEKREP
jgi:protein TonB